MAKKLAYKLSKRIQRIKPSPTLMISAQAKKLQAEGQAIINLSVGEPDFDTPIHIKEAAIKAIQDGQTKYTPVDGTPSLKRAIINKFQHDNQLNYTAEHILVSCGAKHSIYNALSAIINPHDEVIIPAPYWVSYPDMVKLCDGSPVILTTEATQQFKITPAQLLASITKKTRAIILNSPSNPTGIAYTHNELQALAQVLLEHPNIIIISDDIYEKSLWGETTFANIVNACAALYDRTIIINGVSKTYAMTGWRIGYAAGPAPIIAAMQKAQSQNTSNPCSISQFAAEAALTGDQSCIKKMTAAYHERHDFLFNELQTIPGLTCLPAHGTFYSFPSIMPLLEQSNTIKNDLDFASYLLHHGKLAIIPGSAFGAPGHIRISFATSMSEIKQALVQLNQVMHDLMKNC